jgi:phasin family protein
MKEGGFFNLFAAMQQISVDLFKTIQYTSYNQIAAVQYNSKKEMFIMFTQLTEQFTTAMKSFNDAEQLPKAMKPFNALVELNSNTVEQLINQQTALITTIMNDSLAQTKALSAEKNLATAIESQKAFTEALQAKVTASVKEAYDRVTKTSEEVVNLVKSSVAEAPTLVK